MTPTTAAALLVGAGVSYVAIGVVVWRYTPAPSDGPEPPVWKQICLWPVTVLVAVIAAAVVVGVLRDAQHAPDGGEQVDAAKERSAEIDDWSEVTEQS